MNIDFSKVENLIIREYKTFQDLVELYLREYPSTRNNDKLLMWCVWNHIARDRGKKIFIPFELFKDLPSIDTIKRHRARLQNTYGLYPPTDITILKRRQRQSAISKYYRRRR